MWAARRGAMAMRLRSPVPVVLTSWTWSDDDQVCRSRTTIRGPEMARLRVRDGHIQDGRVVGRSSIQGVALTWKRTTLSPVEPAATSFKKKRSSQTGEPSVLAQAMGRMQETPHASAIDSPLRPKPDLGVGQTWTQVVNAHSTAFDLAYCFT